MTQVFIYEIIIVTRTITLIQYQLYFFQILSLFIIITR